MLFIEKGSIEYLFFTKQTSPSARMPFFYPKTTENKASTCCIYTFTLLCCFVTLYCLKPDKKTTLATPLYSLSVYDDFTNSNGEELDSSCSEDYSLAWQLKATGMIATLNGMLATGQLCLETDGHLSVLTSSATFFSEQSQVRSLISNWQPLVYNHSYSHVVLPCSILVLLNRVI